MAILLEMSPGDRRRASSISSSWLMPGGDNARYVAYREEVVKLCARAAYIVVVFLYHLLEKSARNNACHLYNQYI